MKPSFSAGALPVPARAGALASPRRFAAAPLLLSLVLSGAALVPSAAAAQQRVRSLAEIRHEGVVMQQWDTSCGAAALATLLSHDLGDPVTERQVAARMLRGTDAMRVRSRGGFSLLDMQEFAKARGYQADGYGEVSMTDLAGMLPAIVPVNFHGYDHFVVVRRIEDGQVFFADPAFGRRSVPYHKFERAWESRIAFVVIVPG